jgi:hypothetical protein
MTSIVLKGDDLEFWKKHSELIQDIAEIEPRSDSLTLTKRLLFGNGEYNYHFTNDDWEFLKKMLRSKKIHYTKSKKFGEIIYNMKNYKKENAEKILDYIRYDDPSVNKPPRVNHVENNNNGFVNMRRNERFRDNMNRELTEEEIDALEEAEEEQLLKQKANASSLKRKTRKEKKNSNLLKNNTTKPYRKTLSRRNKQETYRREHIKKLMKETKNLFEKLK